MCVCEGGKGREVGKGESEGEGGWGSCDPTAVRAAPRQPASQARETQARVGAPLTRRELVESSPRRGGDGGLGRPAARLVLFCRGWDNAMTPSCDDSLIR